MKKLLFFALLFLFGCRSKEIVVVEGIPTRSLEPGKYYSSIKYRKDERFQYEKMPFILESIPPDFEKKIVVLDQEFLKKQCLDGFPCRIGIKPPSFALKFRNEDLSDFVSHPDAEGFLLYFLEVPAKFRTFSEKELKKSGYRIEKMILKNPSKIVKRYVKKKPKELKENQCFFEAGYYSPLREEMAIHRDNFGVVLKIKTKLIDLGYELEKNDNFDKQTKAALIDFQKKNGLPSGNLDYKTLQKLEIDL